MIRGISGSVNDALSGVKELEVIQIKAPTPTGDQYEEQDGQMWSSLRAPAFHRSAAAEPQRCEVRVEGQDSEERDDR